MDDSGAECDVSNISLTEGQEEVNKTSFGRERENIYKGLSKTALTLKIHG